MAASPGSFAHWLGATDPLRIGLAFLAFYFCVQLTMLAHELGHAAVGLARTEGLVVVRVGYFPPWRARLGRLQLELAARPPRRGAGGEARLHAQMGRAARIGFVLAGPAAGASFAVLVLGLGIATHTHVLMFAGAYNIFASLINLVPFERHQARSDGARLLDALRDGGAASRLLDPLADPYSRWLVLFTDVRRALGPTQLLQLGGAPVAVGYAHDDRGDTAVALWRLACAGWCWREAECPDLSAIREQVLDERQAAARREVRRDEIVVSAARELAVSSSDDAGLNQAFARVRKHFSHPSTRDDHERFAFRFGVALHDVERIAG